MQINRIGQKVVCLWPALAWKLGCAALQHYPVEGQTYTVSGFGDAFTMPGIHLSEVPGYECLRQKVAGIPWPLAAFRPLDERETDISALKEILNVTPAAPERVDA